VGKKGGVSVYGLQRFPVTLYPEQWQRLFEEKEVILNFINTHASKLRWHDAPIWSPCDPFVINPSALRKAHLEVRSGNYKYGE
jgi:hypothetical protein